MEEPESPPDAEFEEGALGVVLEVMGTPMGVDAMGTTPGAGGGGWTPEEEKGGQRVQSQQQVKLAGVLVHLQKRCLCKLRGKSYKVAMLEWTITGEEKNGLSGWRNGQMLAPDGRQRKVTMSQLLQNIF
jgi:hypothetical protein